MHWCDRMFIQDCAFSKSVVIGVAKGILRKAYSVDTLGNVSFHQHSIP